MIVEKTKKFDQDSEVTGSERNYPDGWFRNYKFQHELHSADKYEDKRRD